MEPEQEQRQLQEQQQELEKWPWWGSRPSRRDSGVWLTLGILLALLGAIAIGSAAITTLISMKLLGWLLLVGAVIQVIHTFTSREGGHWALSLIGAILYLILGFFIITRPEATGIALTLLLSMFFMTIGLIRVFTASSMILVNRGWVMLSGVIVFLAGLALFLEWPISGIWAIGLLIGIEFLVNGIYAIALGVKARRIAPQAAT